MKPSCFNDVAIEIRPFFFFSFFELETSVANYKTFFNMLNTVVISTEK